MRNYLTGIMHDRTLLSELSDYCEHHTRYILALSGLRRTGKTVLMMRQALRLLDAGKNAAYLQISEIDTQQSLFRGVDSAIKNGAQYIFIDEVTYVDGFARWGDWLYCSTVLKGVHCIISGTDSFGLVLASGNVLFDRIRFVKTTYMSYAEYHYITDGKPLSEYLHTGGIFSAFDLDEYVDTSIVNNIVHSINRYSDHGYRELAPLLDDELSSAIIKTIANVTIRFLIGLLVRSYKYPDLRSALDLLSRHGSIFSAEAVNAIQVEVAKHLKISEKLDRFSNKQKEEFVDYLKFILEKIDVVTEYDFEQSYTDNPKQYTHKEHVITQPGLRYEQTRVYLEVLCRLNNTGALLMEQITQDMEGKLLEAAILTSVIRKLYDGRIGRADRKHDVFKFARDDYEFDMVIVNLDVCALSVFEIKRSGVIDTRQYSRLLDNGLINAAVNTALLRNIGRIGKIEAVSRYVLYMGAPAEVDNVKYVNIEDFLLNGSVSAGIFFQKNNNKAVNYGM